MRGREREREGGNLWGIDYTLDLIANRGVGLVKSAAGVDLNVEVCKRV